MKLNLNLLPLELDQEIIIPQNFYEKTDIVLLSPIHVKGKIYYNLSDEVEINLNIQGTMDIKDSITLEIIKYPININIEENLENYVQDGTFFWEKEKNTLDIIEFLWENIVLEVPISVTKATGTNLKGDGWELNKEEEEDEIDSCFLKLKDLNKGGE